jgi:hypothetical protein
MLLGLGLLSTSVLKLQSLVALSGRSVSCLRLNYALLQLFRGDGTQGQHEHSHSVRDKDGTDANCDAECDHRHGLPGALAMSSSFNGFLMVLPPR